MYSWLKVCKENNLVKTNRFRPVANLLIHYIQGTSLHIVTIDREDWQLYEKLWLRVVSLFMKSIGNSPKQMENYYFISLLQHYIKTQPSTHTQSVKLCYLFFECTYTTENQTWQNASRSEILSK